MNVYLIGFMGCGKSTLGKKLAKKKSYFFCDMDAEIENIVGMSISKLFEKEGEESFRKHENDFLTQITKDKNQNKIVSTGGGTPCFFNNMELMNNDGLTIYIKLPVKVLADRLRNEKSKRPLIANLTSVELEDFIETKLKERSDFYKKSKVIFDPLNQKESELLDIINSYSI